MQKKKKKFYIKIPHKKSERHPRIFFIDIHKIESSWNSKYQVHIFARLFSQILWVGMKTQTGKKKKKKKRQSNTINSKLPAL